jgi:hypothetical protein
MRAEEGRLQLALLRPPQATLCSSRAATTMAGDSATSESYKSSYASMRARAPPLSAFAAVPPLSIFRLSPLVCINQDLVDELEIIRRARKMLHGCASSFLARGQTLISRNSSSSRNHVLRSGCVYDHWMSA